MGEEEGSLVRQIAKERKRRIAEKGETNKDIRYKYEHKYDTKTNAKVVVVVVVYCLKYKVHNYT